MNRRKVTTLLITAIALAALVWGVVPSNASTPKAAKAVAQKTIAPLHRHKHVTNADRQAAAARAKALRASAVKTGKAVYTPTLDPTRIPDYFGTTPNYANSPLPTGPIGSIMVLDRGKVRHLGQGRDHRHQLGIGQGRQGQGQGRQRPYRVHHRHRGGSQLHRPPGDHRG